MAGGLTAAMNKVSSTFEDIPKSFGQGLQSGTNIRVQNNQDKRAQSQSDFKKLKSLVEIQMPKLRKLDPEQRKVLIEKVKEENSEIVKRLGFETFTTAFTEQVSFELNIKATESTREDYYQRTGEEAPFKVGDFVTKTMTNDGGISYSNIGSSTNGEKDLSPANFTKIFTKFLTAYPDPEIAKKKFYTWLKNYHPNSSWNAPDKLNRVEKEAKKKAIKNPTLEEKAAARKDISNLAGKPWFTPNRTTKEKAPASKDISHARKPLSTRKYKIGDVIKHPKSGHEIRLVKGDGDKTGDWEDVNK